MELGLKGKVAIVTGGAGNIGRGIVLGMAAEGVKTVIAEVDVGQAQKVAAEAEKLGAKSIVVRTDVTDWDSVQATVKTGIDEFGQIDILVNNAGGLPGTGAFVKKSREDWDKEIKLNLWGTINCIRAVVDHMMARKYGKIVNISSGSGQFGPAGSNLAVYAASKGGVIALGRALAWEFGRFNINVNTVAPGSIVPHSDDDVSQSSTWKQWGSKVYTPEVLEQVRKSWPIQRLGQPEDIADMVLFFASDRASFLTGQTISVSGGAIMW